MTSGASLKRGGFGLLFLALAAVANPAAASMTLEITGHSCEPGAPCRFGVYLEHIPTRVGQGAPTRTLVERVEMRGDISVGVDHVEEGHRLVVENQGFWCAAEAAPEFSDRQVAHCHLVPASVVSGELEMKLPAAEIETAEKKGFLTVWLSSLSPAEPNVVKDQPLAEVGSGTGVGDPAIGFLCPFAERKFSCILPIGKYDARFELAGYSPRFVRDLRVDQQSRQLDLTFQPGALVGGWIEALGQGATLDDISVFLLPALGPSDANPRSIAALERLSPAASIDSKGRYLFEGVAAGKYVLRAVADGSCPTEIDIQIPHGIRTVEVREALVFDRCAALELLVDPPVDFWGQPWSLELRQRQSAVGTLGQGKHATVGLNGWGLVDSLPTGNWKASLHDSKGAVWWTERITLAAQTESFHIQLESVEVRGTVMRGEEPVPGTLVFGTRSRSPLIPLAVDEEGSFHGFLPNEGEWPLELDDGKRIYFPGTYEVEQKPGKSYAELEISLSGARLKGTVLDGDEPVEDAFVYAFRNAERLEKEAFVRTDRDGRFVIEDVRPGRLRLLARMAALSSESRTLEVIDDEEIRDLTLTLQRRPRIRGRVTALGRGIPGAKVLAFGPQGRTDLDKVASTGIDGTFSLDVQPGAGSMDLAMVASGFAFDVQSIQLGDSQSQEVLFEAQAMGAEVVIPLASSRPDGHLLARGANVRLSRLLPLMFEAGLAVFEAPASARLKLAPGTWSFCTGRSPICTSETVSVGQILFLDSAFLDSETQN